MSKATKSAPILTTAFFEERAVKARAKFVRAAGDGKEHPFKSIAPTKFDEKVEELFFRLLTDAFRHRFIFRAQATSVINHFHEALSEVAKAWMADALSRRRGLPMALITKNLSVQGSVKVQNGVDSFGCDGARDQGKSNVDAALFWGEKCLWIWEDKLSFDSANKNNATGLSDRFGEVETLRENNTCARISSVAIHPEVSHRIETRKGVAHCEIENVTAKGIAKSIELRSEARNVFLRDFWFKISPAILKCDTRAERSQVALGKNQIARVESMRRLCKRLWAAAKSDLLFVEESIALFEASAGKQKSDWRPADPAFAGRPATHEIQGLRLMADLAPAQAAGLLAGCTPKMWAAYENGTLPMETNHWELFKVRVTLILGAKKSSLAGTMAAGYLSAAPAPKVRVSQRRARKAPSLAAGRQGELRISSSSGAAAASKAKRAVA